MKQTSKQKVNKFDKTNYRYIALFPIAKGASILPVISRRIKQSREKLNGVSHYAEVF